MLLFTMILLVAILLIGYASSLKREKAMTKNRILPLILIGICTLVISSACGNDHTETVENLELEIDKNEEVTEQNDELEQMNEELNEDMDDLADKVDDLTTQTDKLKEDYDELKSENTKLEKSNDKLKKDAETLTEENDTLKQENSVEQTTNNNNSSNTTDSEESDVETTTTNTEVASESSGDCNIKGSENGIYHTPGSTYYDRTKNVVEWFCSTGEAVDAGY